MAENEPTSTHPTPQLKPDEMSGLAARLRARADSVLLRDQPEQQSDMRTAARLIEQLVRLHAEIRRAADNTEDEASERHLRELLGGQ
jgi:hypothetical protein